MDEAIGVLAEWAARIRWVLVSWAMVVSLSRGVGGGGWGPGTGWAAPP